jgi:hypothetical protein
MSTSRRSCASAAGHLSTGPRGISAQSRTGAEIVKKIRPKEKQEPAADAGSVVDEQKERRWDMNRAIIGLIVVCGMVQPLLAQRDKTLDKDLTDRLTRRDVSTLGARTFHFAAELPSTNVYIKAAATDVDGDVSPSATLGLNHKEEQNPWFTEVTYKHQAGDTSHRNVFSGFGSYQFWTGSGSLSPLLIVDASYSTRPGSNQSAYGDITGEISFKRLTIDAIAGFSQLHLEGDDTVSDFVPGLSAFYTLSKTDLIGIDYTFKNDVDEEDSFDISFRHKLPANYAVDVVVFKHSDIRFRIRKDFKAFKPRGLR